MISCILWCGCSTLRSFRVSPAFLSLLLPHPFPILPLNPVLHTLPLYLILLFLLVCTDNLVKSLYPPSWNNDFVQVGKGTSWSISQPEKVIKYMQIHSDDWEMVHLRGHTEPQLWPAAVALPACSSHDVRTYPGWTHTHTLNFNSFCQIVIQKGHTIQCMQLIAHTLNNMNF